MVLLLLKKLPTGRRRTSDCYVCCTTCLPGTTGYRPISSLRWEVGRPPGLSNCVRYHPQSPTNDLRVKMALMARSVAKRFPWNDHCRTSVVGAKLQSRQKRCPLGSRQEDQSYSSIWLHHTDQPPTVSPVYRLPTNLKPTVGGRGATRLLGHIVPNIEPIKYLRTILYE